MGRKKKTIQESVPTLRQILVRFWPLIRRQRLLIAGSGLAMFGEVAFRLLEPWPLKFVFDRLIPPAESAVTGGWIGNIGSGTLLLLCALAVVVFTALRASMVYIRRVGFALAGSRILAQCRTELFTHLQRLSLSFYSKKRVGDLITRVTGDIGQLKEVAITAAMPFVAHCLTLVAMLAVMVLMDWRLALVGLAIVPLFALSTKRLGGRIRKVARKQRQRKGELGAAAAEVMGSIKVVQALSLEKIQQKSFSAANRSDLKEGVKAKRLLARLVGTTDVLIGAASAVVLWQGALLVIAGHLTPGDLIVFLAYLKSAFRPMHNMAKYSGRIAKAAASAERILEVMDTTPLIQDRSDAVEAPLAVEAVALERVGFGYEPSHLALDGVDLAAQRGRITVLAGPSGAGKSTIVNLMLRLYDPDEGRVLLNGRDVREFTVHSLRMKIAVVPQENVLFRVSVRDNIAYGNPDASDEQIIAAAKLARAHGFIKKMAEGYETVVGERGQTLSEGQRQRIAIARAAVREAPILVLDEPTSSLDSENTRLVREALRALSAERICFIIAHDLGTVQEDNFVYFLDQGRIVEQGSHSVLLAGGGPYARMYAVHQQRGEQRPVGETHAVGG